LILGLFTELGTVGGVQRAGLYIAAVLTAYAQNRNLAIRIWVLNNPQGLWEKQMGEISVRFRGAGRSKVRLTVQTLRSVVNRPRLVLAGHPHLAPLAWLVQRLVPRSRTVVQCHGVEVWSPLPPWTRRALKGVSQVWAPSEDTAEKAVRVQGIPACKVRVIPWPVDPTFMEEAGSGDNPRLPQGFPKGRVILFVGRLDARERYKGIDRLIEALPHVVVQIPDAHLVIVGDGDDRDRLESLVRKRGMTERVHFLGSLSEDALKACYIQSTVFAMPSRAEGFGLVFLEAMAMGKPVIAGDHGGARSVVVDGQTGYLVTQDDLQGLIDRLVWILRDDALRLRMGQRARAWVTEHFTFSRFRDRVFQALDALLAVGRGRLPYILSNRACSIYFKKRKE